MNAMKRMRRGRSRNGAGAWLAGMTVALGALLAIAVAPSARRYLRLRQM